MEIIALKLVTGEDVLGELEAETELVVVLSNPVGIAVVRGKDGQPNIGFSPFPIHAEQKKDSSIVIQNKHVVYHYVPAEDFVTNYKQIFGSGIVLPPTKQIITG